MKALIVILLLQFMFLNPVVSAYAELYKHRDEKGIWHFSDTPDATAENVEIIKTTGGSIPSGSDLSALIFRTMNPKNSIEKAAAGTVLVKSGMGTGSGFFITKSGYIITNRHVLHGDEKMVESSKKQYEYGEARLEEYRIRLEQDKKTIEAARDELEEYRKNIEKKSDLSKKSRQMEKYEIELARLESYEREHDVRKAEYERVKGDINSRHSQLSWASASSGLARSVDITLADGSQLTAELVEVSKNNDLALLKVSGIINAPALSTGQAMSMPQGTKVFAIGNPVELHNSVADGIISGFEGQYVKTNAKIYPGNSGGPLVDESGNVIGINTLKLITHKFEGLGFAIRIDVAMNEFAGYLNQ